MNRCIVITTINKPTRRLLGWLHSESDRLIVVGDKKTPNFAWKEFSEENPGIVFLDSDQQAELFPKLSEGLGWGTYSRKNIGYAYASRLGGAIFETDDDTFPRDGLWELLDGIDEGGLLASEVTSDSIWWNPYTHFAPSSGLWPRGFPLEDLSLESTYRVSDGRVVPKNYVQFLVNNEPDLDAIFRLTKRQIEFDFPATAELLNLQATYSPGNTQATYIKRATELLYFPSTCSLRVADIIRSYWMQALEGVTYGGFLVEQVRNPHDYLEDFKLEIPLYTSANEIMRSILESADRGLEEILKALVRLGVLLESELDTFRLFREEIQVS